MGKRIPISRAIQIKIKEQQNIQQGNSKTEQLFNDTAALSDFEAEYTAFINSLKQQRVETETTSTVQVQNDMVEPVIIENNKTNDTLKTEIMAEVKEYINNLLKEYNITKKVKRKKKNDE